jgi:tetratricopeptide (TPR) repeat protein
MQNFYQLFGIQPRAKESEIRDALRNASRLWLNKTNAPQIDRRQEAERMVGLIDEAEAILLNSGKRAEYDQRLKSAPVEEEPTDKKAIESAQDLVAEGRGLLAAGNIADALYVATKATERDGGNPEAWALLGEARFRFGDVDDAIYEYRRAIKLKPNEPFYYSELGDIFTQAVKFDEALGQYERAVKTAPNVPMFRAAVANVLLRQDKASEATPILEECVREEPNNGSFQWGLAIAYVDSCQDSWTYVRDGENVPEGYYATSKAQVLQALERIRKTETLRYDDPVLKEHIGKVREDVKRMLQRKYAGRTAAAIVGGIIYLPVFGLGLVFAPLYFYASRPPQYELNKTEIKGGTVGDKVLAKVGKVHDALAAGAGTEGSATTISIVFGLMTLVATAALLPVMAIVNYMKNYTGENDLKDLQIQ